MRAARLAPRVRGLIDLNMPRSALECADQAVSEAFSANSLDAVLRALDARLFALLHQSDMSQAVSAGKTLIEAAENAGDMVLATRGRCNTGSALNHLGMFEDARVVLERALTDARTRR